MVLYNTLLERYYTAAKARSLSTLLAQDASDFANCSQSAVKLSLTDTVDRTKSSL